MGNTASSEQPLRAPQKLSKPRVGNLTSSSELLSPISTSTPNILARPSSSDPAVSPSGPSSETIDAMPTEYHALSSEDVTRAEGASEAGQKANEEQDITDVPRFATSPLPPDLTSRRKSTGLLSSGTVKSLERPKSSSQEASAPPLTLSMNSGDKSSRRASHYDLRTGSAVKHQKSSPNLREYRGLKPATKEVTTGQTDDTDSSRTEGAHQQAMEALFGATATRTETTLYAPSRRRSAVLTPGVATRSQTEPTLTSKRSFPRSLTVASEKTRPVSRDAKPKRRTSMPAPPTSSYSPQRVATPTESPYRQLGGMQFGSLRIMNATPVASPDSRQHQRTLSSGLETGSSPHVVVDDSDVGPLNDAIVDEVKILQPSPLLAVSPAAPLFGEASLSGVESSVDSQYSPFSTPTKSEDATPLTQPTSYAEKELELTDPQHDEGKAGLEDHSKHETPATSVSNDTRSENGDTSTTTSKSQSLRAGLSFRSLFGSRKKAKQTKDTKAKCNTDNEPKPFKASDQRPALQHHAPFEPTSTSSVTASSEAMDDPPTMAAHARQATCESQTAEGPTADQGQRPLGDGGPRVAGHSRSQHVRGSSAPNAIVQQVLSEKPTSSSEDSNGDSKPKKLQKLITSARRRSLPSINANSGDLDPESVPAMPVDAEVKLQEHTRNFDRMSKRFSLRLDPSKDSVNQVVQVDAETSENMQKPLVHEKVTFVKSELSLPPPGEQEKPTRASSIRSLKPPSVRRLRKPKTSSKVPEDNEDSDDDMLPDYVAGYESQVSSISNIRRSVGNSAFDAAFVALAEDSPYDNARYPPPGPVAGHAARPKTPVNSGPYPRLRSRSSAPNFLDTVSEPASPGSVDCWSQKKPKTPPPVSIRTRGSKKKRRPKSLHSGGGPRMQHPPMPGQFMPVNPGHRDGPFGPTLPEQPDLTRSLRSYPVPRPASYVPTRAEHHRQPGHASDPARGGSARSLYPSMGDDQMGPYPPLPRPASSMPLGGHLHGNVQGSHRGLHSHNAPAYKAVPIRT